MKNNNYYYNYININYEINQISILLEIRRMKLIQQIKNKLQIILNKYNIDVNNIFPRWIMLYFNKKSNFFVDPIIPFFTKEPNNKQLTIDIKNLHSDANSNKLIKKMDLKNKCNKCITILRKYIETNKNKIVHVKIIKNNDFYYFQYKNYEYKLHEIIYDKLVKLCTIKNNINDLIFCLILRYNTLESYNQQLAVNPDFYNYLKNTFNVNFELFASPFNCFFDNYCSLFYDLEKYFNSKGNFRNIRINQGFYVANPPYDETIMNKMTFKLLKRLNKSEYDLSFIIIIPVWNDP